MQYTKRSNDPAGPDSNASSSGAAPIESPSTEAAPIEAADIVVWLRTHTDFFLEYPELLTVMALPSESGTTISFAQRQASLLRKRNSDLRGRLQALLANAETNDALFEKTRALSLTLQRAESEDAFGAALANDLIDAFAADHLACYLRRTPQQTMEGKPLKGLLYWTERYPLEELFDPEAARCVTLRTRELDQLFPSRQSRDEGSAVLIPLANSDGMLAIGSDNRERFSNNMGMLFVDFIGELVDVTAQRLLRARDGTGGIDGTGGTPGAVTQL